MFPTVDSANRAGQSSSTGPTYVRTRSLIQPLLLGLFSSLLVLAFAHLGSEIGEGETLGFDSYFARGARTLRLAHPWLADVMRDWSGLGSLTVMTFLTIATVGFLALNSLRVSALFMVIAVVAGALLVTGFKSIFDRARPGPDMTDLVVSGFSFPSGHASTSAIVFLTLGTLVASTRARNKERVYVLVTAALLTFFVGISRIALGVHWATDVLGGWAFGISWAVMCLLVANWLNRTNNVGRKSDVAAPVAQVSPVTR